MAMYGLQRTPAWIATLAFSATVACVAGGGGGGTSSGGGGGVQAVASGGAVGANCPAEDSIGCAPGFGEKVRCKGGLWVSDGKCDAGASCVETAKGPTVTATRCAFKTFAEPGRAVACMQLAPCGFDAGWISCASFNLTAAAGPSSYVAKFGGAYKVRSIADDMLSTATLSCLQTAASCGAVGSCISGPLGACKAGEVAGCSGSVGWECGTGGVRWSVDCAAVGLQCMPYGKDTLCGTPATGCQPGMTGVACKGDDANVCITEGGVSIGFAIHCGAAGMTCGPTSKVDDDLDACAPKSAVPCDAATFVAHCDGNKRVRCKGGLQVAFDCGLQGGTCKVETAPDPVDNHAACKAPPSACSGPSTCDGDLVNFCANGVRYSVDCAQWGLKCGHSEAAYGELCRLP